MGVTDKIWGALTSMIKLEDKVNRHRGRGKVTSPISALVTTLRAAWFPT